MRVDYDNIAPNYDERYAMDESPGILRVLLDTVRKRVDPVVLEVGCGTGHWLEPLSRFSKSILGLEPSSGMLRQARRKRVPASLIGGRAEELPFRDEGMDFVFVVNALHHFADPGRFIREAHRILQHGGTLALIGGDPRSPRNSWYGYRYFEGSLEADLARFPRWDSLRTWLSGAGFVALESREIDRVLDPRHGREVLHDPFLRKGSSSTLAMISQDAYARGLESIREDVDNAESQGLDLLFETELTILEFSGVKT